VLDLLARMARATTSIVARGVVLLILIEGTASLIGFALAVAGGLPPERERLHMRFDPDLGWTSAPDTRFENLFGPGRHLTINGQGVRAKRAYTPARPIGRRRALCVGNGFTLGPGVDDDSTWCARLERLEPGLETVNLGQEWYGADQSYLHARRDGAQFDFDFLLFAFTRDDFARMEKDNYHHYGKPVLRIGPGGALEVHNVPVPDRGRRMPWLVRNWSLFERLRVVELARPALRALRPHSTTGLTAGELAELAGKIFQELQRFCEERGATLVLIDLPTYADYENPGALWRERIAREARKRGLPFFDLVEELRSVPRGDVARLYEPIDASGLRSSEMPYGEAGHEWVAESIRGHLRQLPRVASALDSHS